MVEDLALVAIKCEFFFSNNPLANMRWKKNELVNFFGSSEQSDLG